MTIYFPKKFNTWAALSWLHHRGFPLILRTTGHDRAKRFIAS